MKKAAIILLLVFPIFCFSKTLKLEDVNEIMDRFFEYHVENKELNDTIVKRWVKGYIEQFDSGKVYLLQEEVLPFLDLSSKDAKKMVAKISKKDFSDFIALNELIQKAILRSRDYRIKLEKLLILNDESVSVEHDKFVDYASNLKELEKRQRNTIISFYSTQKEKGLINSVEKKEKLFSLLERKLSRFENNFLHQNQKGQELSLAEKQHFLSVRILKSFAKSLDAHSSFFSEEEAEEMRMSLEKQFDGIGVVLSEGVEGVIITDLIKNSPAEKSGQIQTNDIVVEIDSQSVESLAFEEVLELLKQKEQSNIVLGIRRIVQNQMSDIYRVKLKREPITMEDDRLSYSFEPYGNGIIGKLDLRAFYENQNGVSSEQDIKNAIRNLRKEGELKGLILDLRENAGGFLSQAVKVCGLFITNGVVVIAKNGKGELNYLRTISEKAYYNGPLIVLTSKLSASASEIVAAALQDYGVAVIVGDESTFGKGSIQYQTVTDENADVYFKVTIGKYYTVSGKTTQIEGVKADIVIPSNYSAFTIGEKYLEYPLSNDKVEPAFVDPLSDVEAKAKFWLKQNYIPLIQRQISFWKNKLPALKQNSYYRQTHDVNFKAYLKEQVELKASIQNQTFKNFKPTKFGVEDLQLQEAINVIKDMIYLQMEAAKAS